MRDSVEALRVALFRVKSAIQEGKYLVASRLATDIIRLSYHLESKTELFLGEVLEGIYLQIHQGFEMYEIPDADKNDLNAKMIKHIDRLLVAYSTQNDLWDILVDIRYDVTVFQFTVSVKYEVQERIRHGPG